MSHRGSKFSIAIWLFHGPKIVVRRDRNSMDQRFPKHGSRPKHSWGWKFGSRERFGNLSVWPQIIENRLSSRRKMSTIEKCCLPSARCTKGSQGCNMQSRIWFIDEHIGLIRTPRNRRALKESVATPAPPMIRWHTVPSYTCGYFLIKTINLIGTTLPLIISARWVVLTNAKSTVCRCYNDGVRPVCSYHYIELSSTLSCPIWVHPK